MRCPTIAVILPWIGWFALVSLGPKVYKRYP